MSVKDLGTFIDRLGTPFFLGQSHEGLKSWPVFVILQTPTSCLIAVFSKRQRSRNIITIPRIRASGFLFGILFLGGNYIKMECV